MLPEAEPAALIREMRRRLGMSQNQFARKLGVTFLTVNRWENGHTRPCSLSVIQLRRLLRRMGARDLDAQYFLKD
jgi:DNA-binding transcriptional regulator YiaG